MVTFEICEIFSNCYLSYVRDYKATRVGGNKYFMTGDKIYKEISLIQHTSFDIHSCNKLRDDILKVTNKDQITLAVMVDYSKAFDTVDYEISITKMHHLNFEKQLLQLKVSYLHKR